MRKCVLPLALAILLGGPNASLAQGEPSQPAAQPPAEVKPTPAAQPATPESATEAVQPGPTPAPTATVGGKTGSSPAPPPTAEVVPSPTALPPATAAIDSKREVMHKYEADRLKLRLALDKFYKENRYNLRAKIAQMQQLCQTMEAKVGRDNPAVVAMYSALAIFYRLGGQNQTAAPLMKWCIDGGKKVMTDPKGKRLIPILQLHLADMYVEQGKYDEARSLIKEALPKVEAMQGSEPRAKQALGFAYVTQSRLAARDGNYERAVELLTRGRGLILSGQVEAKSSTPRRQ